jgi:dTDP-4-amino-4,6-dideoxygalactose transaminase
MESLLDLNIPIIEDLAMSLFSTNDSSRIGKYGDFTIYSLPKFFLFSLEFYNTTMIFIKKMF